MEKMNYILIPEPGKVQVREMEKPEKVQGEALLEILYGGICGSDMGTYRGTFLYSSYPRIPGHEFSARVVAVDDNKYGIKRGMIVTGNPYFNCGSCYSCRRGMINCCTGNQTLGAQRDGIFRQYFSMPVERIYDGKGLDPQVLAMIEPFCISYHAVKRGSVKAGDRVLVVGAGPIGVLAVMGAKLMGATVAVSDISEGRLQVAREMGADDVIVINKENFDERVREFTGGDGFDVCIECVGQPSTFQNCIDAASFRGRVVVVGIGNKNLDFAYSCIQTKELDIFGSRNAVKEDFVELIDFAVAGRFDLSKLISRVYVFADAERAFTEVKDYPDAIMKVLVAFQ